MPRYVRCPDCRGSGKQRISGPSGTVRCGRCGGFKNIDLHVISEDELVDAWHRIYGPEADDE